MSDLTILYYTANTIPEATRQKVSSYLLKVTKNQYPIISVSQKPINFGKNICVGEIGRSKYNCYKQILIGVQKVKTKYVACAEDDTLYSAEHFLFRPKAGVFTYDTNVWYSTENSYWRRDEVNNRGGMWGCISTTSALLKNLTKRYSMYPTDPLPKGDKHLPETKNRFLFWGEPGYHDEVFGIKNRLAFFEAKEPTVVFLYWASMGGKQTIGRYKIHTPENVTYNLKPFGGAGSLWSSYWTS